MIYCSVKIKNPDETIYGNVSVCRNSLHKVLSDNLDAEYIEFKFIDTTIAYYHGRKLVVVNGILIPSSAFGVGLLCNDTVIRYIIDAFNLEALC